jgi:hypothetical protein
MSAGPSSGSFSPSTYYDTSMHTPYTGGSSYNGATQGWHAQHMASSSYGGGSQQLIHPGTTSAQLYGNPSGSALPPVGKSRNDLLVGATTVEAHVIDWLGERHIMFVFGVSMTSFRTYTLQAYKPG